MKNDLPSLYRVKNENTTFSYVYVALSDMCSKTHFHFCFYTRVNNSLRIYLYGIASTGGVEDCYERHV